MYATPGPPSGGKSGILRAVHGQGRPILAAIESLTRPRPVAGVGDQTTRYGVVVEVIDLLVLLLIGIDIHVVPTAVPNSVPGVMVHGGRQSKALQHLLILREGLVMAQVA
jgi:hypothetical protein